MIDCTSLPQDYLGNLNKWAKINKIPLNMTLELTPFCNFSCVMCYVRLNREQAAAQGELLSAEQWIEIAEQAKEMGTLNITLTGGEPFTHPEFWTIYEKLNKMGFLISILSNGSMIDESVMEKFQKYGMPYFVKLTMYGASEETYRRTCGCADGFTRVTKTVELLKKAGTPLNLTATIVRENAEDLQQIYEFARRHGVPLQHTVTVVKSSRGASNTAVDSRFSFDEFTEELTMETLEKNKFPPLDSPFAWCNPFGTSLWMTWNGRLQLCSFLSVPSIVWSGNLQRDWNALMEKGNELRSPPECADCEWSMFCQRCPGILCAESGHPERIDKDLCRTAENLYHLYQKYMQKEKTL